MTTLVVVNDPKDWPLDIAGVTIVAAWDYLTDRRYTNQKGAKVFNLCRSYRYQSTGYYVSLLAAARGHKPIPDVTTIQDMKSQAIVRTASAEIDELIQKSLASIQSDTFVLSIYFGRNLAKRHDGLSRALFKLFQAPFVRAHFARSPRKRTWQIQNLSPIAASEVPPEHRPFACKVAEEYFKSRRRPARRKTAHRYELAILYDPAEAEPPSNERAIRRFLKGAEAVGLDAELIGRDDFARLAEFDALFLRETTSVNHHTYRFARRAEAEGLVVIDDPESILTCTNKVYLAELLERHRIAIPATRIVHRDNLEKLTADLGLPCILKQPDSSFSQGVVKAETPQELAERAAAIFDRSDLIIAQEYLPTDYDWRVGILDRQPLYVSKYFMARRHWQIVKRDHNGIALEDGRVETMPVELAPSGLVRTALRAANLIGDGFYGVDLKPAGKRFLVIEINDNPSIDAGYEDAVLKEELYRRIMWVFLRRIEDRKERARWM